MSTTARATARRSSSPKVSPTEYYRTEFDYGEMGELTEVRMADGGVFTYGYDPNRNRVRQTDGEGNVVAFEYDEMNRLDLMTQDPSGFAYITDHDYDPNGNETWLTDPKGQRVEFKYDELNRLNEKILSSLAVVVGFGALHAHTSYRLRRVRQQR